jgi:hypothetical protein
MPSKGTALKEISRSDLSPSNTETGAQRMRALAMLRTGEKSTFDFRRAGIMQSSTRIFELRALGYVIRTADRRDMYDAEGVRHRGVAVYALDSEPPPREQETGGVA